MINSNYDKRVKRLAAYCTVQYNLLAVYRPEVDTLLMLKEISPTIIKAMMRRSEENLKSLEEISKRTDARILVLQKQNPELANSEEVKKLKGTLSEIREEYKQLSYS